MKRFALLCLLVGCFCTTKAQDTIYVKGYKWCPKEQATGYAIVTKKSPLIKVNYYALDGRWLETTHYTRYVEDPRLRIKTGPSTIFYENGNVKQQTIYKLSKPISFCLFYPDGKIQREDTFNSEGGMETSYIYDSEGNKTQNKEPYLCAPTFPGGDTALGSAILTAMRYPKEAQIKNITGLVHVQFCIDENGRMIEPQVINNTDSILQEAALDAFHRIAKKYTWNPGMEEGKKICTSMTITFVFRIPR